MNMPMQGFVPNMMPMNNDPYRMAMMNPYFMQQQMFYQQQQFQQHQPKVGDNRNENFNPYMQYPPFMDPRAMNYNMMYYNNPYVNNQGKFRQ